MSWIYIVTPFAAWLVAGTLKFAINSLRAKRLAFGLIGYGGLPSNHGAIVSSMACLIALREGVAHPAFGVALTLAFIVILDAASLRRQIGRHAQVLNRLQAQDRHAAPLRERMGHTRLEIIAGVATGMAVAWLVNEVLG
ncbi:MAG: divergent PAP2 family protein [Burkholderiaceae bacterium]|jgi:acid phosphatase family membrane protein YuiD|nr:divergent PAP2 family protein [Burkholderiaceae bacterium]